MKSAEIRTQFLEFFHQRGHDVVASSSLVPGNDPTLLFTNAGMVQFKDVFLGLEQRPYKRAVSSQRCVRAGGKHNDLDNVGYTARHHTFFEMLGNFSFGDYFKREAIQYAWEFLTKTLKLPPERLWITVYDKDDETAGIWLKEQKVDPTRFSRIGEKDNFWSMGDTGPCGPCSEIFYDHGPQVVGGPPGSPDADGDRYVEIWNLVFMQFNRAHDGTLTPLPKPSVDTGMGLERLAAVMQGVHSNYEIELFKKLITVIAELAKTRDFHNPSLRVIADHIRSTAFLVVDGVLPSNEGRGYVVRRIMRRAIRHGYMLGLKESFFYKLVKPLAEEMGEAYPELLRKQEQIERVLRLEEERFAETLEQGLRILEQDLARLSGGVIPGDVLFKLYDTYGFPADLTADIARERGLTVDMAGFEREMEQQRERARAASQFGVAYATPTVGGAATCFTGYAKLNDAGTVVALYRDGKPVVSVSAGDEVSVVLDNTPFYGESGGQVGDQGLLEWSGGELRVADAQKQGDVIVHSGKVARGELKIGDRATASVNAALRKATALNHSATHLLHAALRRLLGEHVQQKGSLVGPNRLRFDFSHFEGVTKEQLRSIEVTVNEQVRHNAIVETQLMKFDDAQKTGAMALFGEKYGDTVRVLRIGDFSTELCGGTHASRAGDIGFFKITSEAGVAAGVRRIEAITGEAAVSFVEESEGRLQRVAEMLKASANDVEDKLDQLMQKLRKLEKESDQLKGKIASSQGSDLATSAVDVGGIKVLAARLDGVDSKSLRDIVDQLKNKLGSAAVVLATVSDGKVSLVAGVTADNTTRVKAGELINHVALQVGGKGGGRPDMAQAGGTNPEALSAALASVVPWVREKLS